MPRRDRRITLGFEITGGPNAGLTHGSWAINTSREDTYIWIVRGVVKVSLHGDDTWRIAYTREHMASGEVPFLPGDDRKALELTPTPFDDKGRRMVLTIAVQRDALLPHLLPNCDVVIPVRDRWDEITAACLWMTEPGANLEPTESVVSAPLPLDSGRQVWISHRTGPWSPPHDPGPPCVTAMVEATDWSDDGPTVPRLLVRGVRLG